jgi:hypothetical protein
MGKKCCSVFTPGLSKRRNNIRMSLNFKKPLNHPTAIILIELLIHQSTRQTNSDLSNPFLSHNCCRTPKKYCCCSLFILPKYLITIIMLIHIYTESERDRVSVYSQFRMMWKMFDVQSRQQNPKKSKQTMSVVKNSVIFTQAWSIVCCWNDTSTHALSLSHTHKNFI